MRDPYIDLEDAMTRLKGNKAIYVRMLRLFLNGRELQQLEEYLFCGEYEKASETAHALKGITGNLSMTALYQLSDQLMQQLRHGAPNPDLLNHYRDAVRQTIAEAGRICNETV